MGQLVCIDTSVLILGIKHSTVKQKNHPQEMVDRTARFLAWLEEEEWDVILPAVCVAEFLMNIPVEDHTAIINLLQKSFKVVPSDAAAAMCFGRMWQSYLQKCDESGNKPRKDIKFDDMVISTAIVHKAKIIYSGDGDIKKMSAHADNRIEVRDIPNIPVQPYLLEN